MAIRDFRDATRTSLTGFIAVAGLLVLFIFAIVFLSIRDHRAVARCHHLGGQTWDNAAHCVIGNYRVVNTR